MKKIIIIALVFTVGYFVYEVATVNYRDNQCSAKTQSFVGNVNPITGEETTEATYVTKSYYEYSKCRSAFPLKTPLLTIINRITRK